MVQWYRLNDKTPVPVELDEELEYLMNYEINMRVAESGDRGGIWVSTVFLGLDHSYNPDGPPILFETMIFGGPHNEYQERYSTWDEAIEGHERACKRAGVPV